METTAKYKSTENDNTLQKKTFQWEEIVLIYDKEKMALDTEL